MWAWFGLPSILVSLNSQQTLPVFAFSVSSTLPLLDSGAPGASFGPFGAISNFVPVALVAALATTTATSASSETPSPMTALRMRLLSFGGGYASDRRTGLLRH